MSLPLTIQPIKVGDLQQYTANTINIQWDQIDFSNPSDIKLYLKGYLLDIGTQIQVPDIVVVTHTNITLSMTLAQIIQAGKDAVLAYSPLFVSV